MVNNQHKPDVFLSTTQAATLLGVSRVSVFKRIKKGFIPATKVGRNFLIKYSDLIGNLTERDKARIDEAVKMAVKEYGETFKLLGKE